MKKSIAITAVAACLAFSAVAEARTSSEGEMRGYDQCIEEAGRDSLGLVTSRNYLLDSAGESNFYYVNATRWEDGERHTVRLSCETSANGRHLINAGLDQGRFSQDASRVTVEVAQN